MTEIRFSCDEPNRMHHFKSDQLHSSEFTCQKNDTNMIPNGKLLNLLKFSAHYMYKITQRAKEIF